MDRGMIFRPEPERPPIVKPEGPPHPNAVFAKQVREITSTIWEGTKGEPLTGRIAAAFVAPIEACDKVNTGMRATPAEKFITPRAMSLAYITELFGVLCVTAAAATPELNDKAILLSASLPLFAGGFLLLRQGVDEAHRVITGSRKYALNNTVSDKFLGLIPRIK